MTVFFPSDTFLCAWQIRKCAHEIYEIARRKLGFQKLAVVFQKLSVKLSEFLSVKKAARGKIGFFVRICLLASL